jgi:DNA-directed RNA polymerase subunit N (RpoN/RPB10)
MIIPIKCFTCGNVLADKYRFYLAEVTKKKLAKKISVENLNNVVYLTNEIRDKSPEGEVLDDLQLKKMCCRRHFLTHVDID